MDDLLDLDWNKPGSKADIMKINQSQPASSSYNFDVLTRSLPTAVSGSHQPMRSATTTAGAFGVTTSSGRGHSTAFRAPPASSQDAFSSLLNYEVPNKHSTDGRSSSQASSLQGPPTSSEIPPTLSTAQRDIVAHNFTSKVDKWEGWDSFEALSPGRQPKSAASVTSSSDNPFAHFDASCGAPAASSSRTSGQQKRSTGSLLDFDSFEDTGAVQSSAFDSVDTVGNLQQVSQARAEARGISSDAEGDFDILGDLGKPVITPAAAPRTDPGIKSSQRSSPPLANSERSSPPPPHLLGQIVEMGFSPIEARRAFANTSSGLDVQAALESLLGMQQGQDVSSSETNDNEMARRLQIQEVRDLKLEEDEAKEARYLATRKQASLKGNLAGPETPSTVPGSSSDREEVTNDWQKQADLLYVQASELGANVFSRANAFWNLAKQQAQKTLEEQRSNMSSSDRGPYDHNSNTVTGGAVSSLPWGRKLTQGGQERRKEWQVGDRPRWLVEAEADAEAKPPVSDSEAPVTECFKDSDREDETAPTFLSTPFTAIGARLLDDSGTCKGSPNASAASFRANIGENMPPSARFEAPGSSAKSIAAFRSAESHVSSTSWGRSKPAAASKSELSAPALRPQTKRERLLCPEDIQPVPHIAAANKETGNQFFREGNYNDAEASYTAALEHLPPTSLRRLPLLNNRASSRLKNGDASAAIRDCTTVIKLTVSGRPDGSDNALYRPSLEAALPVALAADVNIRDAYSKALFRRAQANEMLERYLPALRDWERLEKYEKEEGSGPAIGVRNLRSSQDGVRRCQGAMGKEDSITTGSSFTSSGKAEATAVRSKAQPSAASAVLKAEEAARERMRASAAAQAAEEFAAYSMKDSIDARIGTWKAGKESNIRALLCSLDSIVWDELGWKKVGMNEVLTDPQIKKVYTKAIARLHPDKLTPARTTLEQRLLGNAVFSVLNEAYASGQ